jgi:SNF family Na+-dependent transporter
MYRWGAIFPKVWGLKLIQVFICYFLTSYYVMLMAWSFSMFFDSFKSPFPWVADASSKIDIDGLLCNQGKQCSEAEKKLAENLKKQLQSGDTQFKAEDLAKIKEGNSQFAVYLQAQLGKAVWNEDYFYKETLHKSANIQEQGYMVGHLVGMTFLSYLLTFVCCFKGLQSSGKFAYVSCLSPYVILGILLIKGLTLEGAGTGLNYLFIPTAAKWAKVGQAGTWKTAATQILFSSGVAYGPFMYYGTARGKNHSLVGASFWIPLANSATSMYAALTIFAFLGHVAAVA